MVVYWSQTGNTEAMAQAVAQGIEEAGKKAKLAEVSAVSAADLKDAKAFALGCPAMGAEVIEEDEMEPFVAEVAFGKVYVITVSKPVLSFPHLLPPDVPPHEKAEAVPSLQVAGREKSGDNRHRTGR